MNTATELSRPGLSPRPCHAADSGRAVRIGASEETSSEGASWSAADVGRARICICSPPTACKASGTSWSNWRGPAVTTTFCSSSDRLGVFHRFGRNRIGRDRRIVLRISRRSEHGEARGQQPNALHDNPPQRMSSCLPEGLSRLRYFRQRKNPGFPLLLGGSLQSGNRSVAIGTVSLGLPLRKACISWRVRGQRTQPPER